MSVSHLGKDRDPALLARRRAAALSIHLHTSGALGLASTALAPVGGLVPFQTAVKRVCEDRGSRAPYIQRRMAAKIYAAGIDPTHAAVADLFERCCFSKASAEGDQRGSRPAETGPEASTQSTGSPDGSPAQEHPASELRKRADRALHRSPTADTRCRTRFDHTNLRIRSVLGRELEEDVYQAARQREDFEPCVTEAPSVDVQFDAISSVTSCRWQLEVNLAPAGNGPTLEELCGFLDPREWSECSDYFENTYPVKTSKEGRPLEGPDGEWTRDEEGPSAGEEWSGILFEHWTLSWNEQESAYFKNLLRIDQKKHARRKGETLVWSSDYRLYAALRSGSFNVDRAGGLDVDSGRIEVHVEQVRGKKPGKAQVVVTKRVRFDDWTPGSNYPEGPGDFGMLLNYCAPAFLSGWGEQATSDLVCCRAKEKNA